MKWQKKECPHLILDYVQFALYECESEQTMTILN
jgi:hypothetical protein